MLTEPQPGVWPVSKYRLRLGSRHELETITNVVLGAYADDPVWREDLESVHARLRNRIDSTLGCDGVKYIVAESAGEMVGVSGVARCHDTHQHLLTGPSVAVGHRGHGLGTRLLITSLLELRDLGVRRARVYTAVGSIADRLLYPKFCALREMGVDYPADRATNESCDPLSRIQGGLL